MIITRFSPSPTGNLHIGGVRTALFSYLFAKSQDGEFILRIEDTDQARSTKAYAQAIIEAMDWLGLHPDRQPVYQSDRFERYQAVSDQLFKLGKAYRCYCTKERLETLRAAQLDRKEKPRYDGHCRHQTSHAEGAPYVIRLKSPMTGMTSFQDLVYGPITVSNTELDDLILMRSDGVPTYNFAVVVDDIDMQISHVIRGDDHLNNTPRQIHLYEALGSTLPQFAHLPMILGADGKRLSKRHGAVNVLEFREAGVLPEALLNDLVRLGWAHQNQEIFSLKEMIRYFSLARVSRSPACFDYDKLTWLNQHYLKTLSPDHLLPSLLWQFQRLSIPYDPQQPLLPMIQALVERSKTMCDLAEQSRCYVQETIVYDEAAVKKHIHAGLLEPFTQLYQRFSQITDWQKAPIHEAIVAVCEACHLGMGKVAQPLRVAVTGGASSPSIDETLVLVGQHRVVSRLKMLLDRVKKEV